MCVCVLRLKVCCHSMLAFKCCHLTSDKVSDISFLLLRNIRNAYFDFYFDIPCLQRLPSQRACASSGVLLESVGCFISWFNLSTEMACVAAGSIIVSDWHRSPESRDFFSKILHKKKRRKFGTLPSRYPWRHHEDDSIIGLC